jgi:hypothetical protein
MAQHHHGKKNLKSIKLIMKIPFGMNIFSAGDRMWKTKNMTALPIR